MTGLRGGCSNHHSKHRYYSKYRRKELTRDSWQICRRHHHTVGNDVNHAPISHPTIKHSPDLPVYGVANFAFVDDCHRLGRQQSLAACTANVEAWCGIPYLPALRRPVVDSFNDQLSWLRIAQAMVELGKPKPARIMVVPSIFATDISHARRALPLTKTRGPPPRLFSLPAGKSD